MTEYQKRLLDTMAAFHELCCKSGLVYFAAYGTLLGAVRHKGFIPWDDDIDVYMPRPDYMKLRELAGHRMGNYIYEVPGRNTGNYYYPAGKFFDVTTTVIEKNKFHAKKGVFVDVFPLDGAGNTMEEARKQCRRMELYNYIIASRTSVPRKERSALKNMAIRFSSLFPESLVDTRKMLERFDKKCMKYSYDEAKYVATFMAGVAEKGLIEKTMLAEPALYDFESIQIYGIADYDSYLTRMYGDWRTLPPENNRTSGHEFEFIDLNTPYLD